MPLYGSSLWDHTSPHIVKFHTAWRKCIRKLFGLPYKTHCNLLAPICIDHYIKTQLNVRSFKFLKSLSASKNVLCNISLNLAINGSKSNVSNTMSLLSNSYSISRTQLSNVTSLNNQLTIIHKQKPVSNVSAQVVTDLLDMSFSLNYCLGVRVPFTMHQIMYTLNVVCTE